MYYTEFHQWIEVKGKLGKVGLTRYASKELGGVVFLELPKVGVEVQKGDSVAVVESTKAAFDIYAPVSGKITAVHENLLQHLPLLTQDPEGKAWLFQIEIQDEKELNELLSDRAYQSLVGS